MIIVFLLLFRCSLQSEIDDYDVQEANQFLHKLPSNKIAKLFTVGPLEKEVRLEFDADSQENGHNDVRRSVPEVRLEGRGDRTIPLEELAKKNDRFIRSIGPSFDQPIYEFMIPAGQRENSSILAILKFSTPDAAVVRFSVKMDRHKWFEITEVKRTQIGEKFEYEVPLSQSANADIEPQMTKNSVYKFLVEAKQGKEIYRVRVKILSFSPTTKGGKTEETQTTDKKTETTTVDDVEGSSEEPFAVDLLTVVSTTTTDKSTKMNQEIDTTTTTSGQNEEKLVEGSGEERNRERASLEQEEEDPLSEVVTVSTLIQQKETIKGIEINVTGTHEGVFVVDRPLRKGDLLRGLVISATSKSEETFWLNITVDRPELFSIRPRRIESGGKAYLFCNHQSDLSGDVQLKIMVSDGPVAEEEVVKIKYNRPTESVSSTTLDFKISEDAPSGTVIGHIENGTEMKIVGKSGLFALIGNNLLLSCPSEEPCLDYETQHVHYLLLLSKDGSLKTTNVFIQVEDVNDNTARIETTDKVLRLSDGQLLMPFAVQILDDDTPSTQQNELSAAGDASDFLQLDKIDADLYQVQVKGSPFPGRYELVLRVDDGVHHSKKTHKTVKVLVQNSHSHAHFRRPRYERNIIPKEIVEGEEVLRVELEGLPIDEAKFVILSGNPGWLTIDDYGGTVRFSKTQSAPMTGRFETVIAALDRTTGRILAQTIVSTALITNKEKKVFEQQLFEKTIDREDEEIEFSLGMMGTLDIDGSTIVAIDENGLLQQLKQGAFSIHGDKIVVDKKTVAKLRVVRMEARSGNEKATIIINLPSSSSFLEHRRRMASRPVFPAVPDVLEVVEELPIGHVIVTVPAVDPMTGNSLSVSIIDGGQGSFFLDSDSGALTLAKRMDYDNSTVDKEMGLIFESGEGEYKTIAKMIARLIDSDDNAPQITRESLAGKVVIPEKIPVNTVILRVPVVDLDETSMKEGLTVTLSGSSKTLFKPMITNGTVIVQVAKELDREIKELHTLHLTVEDQAGHKDFISVNVDLSDVNDNAPKFTKEVYDVQAVENWPAGATLETIRAFDPDSMERGQVVYSLLAHNSRHFSVNETSGQLQVSQDLMGLAREEPYVLTAVASDKGVPSFNSTVPIRITVSEPKKQNTDQISFVSPPVGKSLISLNNEVSSNEKVYQAKARIDGDGRNLKYSLKEFFGTEDLFGIDETSGEVIVKKQLKNKEDYCLLLTARHTLSGLEASRLLRIRYVPSVRSEPIFPQGNPLYLPFRKQRAIGSVHAAVEGNEEAFYYLIPSCSPSTGMFSLNSSSGELSHIGPDSPKTVRIELCVLASREPLSETASLVFNGQKASNILVEIVTEHEEHSLPDLRLINNTLTVLDRKLNNARIELDDSAIASSYNFSLGNVSFIPAESVLPLTMAAPLPSLFTVTAGGIVRPSSSLSSQPSGVYAVHVQSSNKQVAVQEFHLIPQSARLRFIFDKQLVAVAKESSAFEKELKSTISRADSAPRLILDQPKILPANNSRSSVCFHVIGPNSLLTAQTTINILSKNGDLFQVYNKFGVVDIAANCEDPMVVVETMSVALSSPASLFAVSVLAFASLFFFIIFVYFCFVRRYRDYLRIKAKSFKAPQAVPSTPTFVLSPPVLPSHSSPHFGYWE